MDEHHPLCGAGDDAPSIQAAIDTAADAGGGTVVIPAGRWKVGAPLRLRENVTLRGVTVTASVLRRTDGAGPVVEVGGAADPGGVEGWAIECLTLDGGGRALHGILVSGDSRFGIVRRAWVRDVAHDGVRVQGGAIQHLCVEALTVEHCGRAGLTLRADPAAATGIFLSEIAVHDFGRRRGTGPEYAAVRLGARCIVTQLHIEPVAAGRVGLLLGAGSDHTSVTGLYVGSRGGAPCLVSDGVAGTTVGTPSVRYLPETA
jgi:hypothetical protein